jgi:hypothetical protein
MGSPQNLPVVKHQSTGTPAGRFIGRGWPADGTADFLAD